ncbi:hypothetical protein ASE37_24880 [Rhizobium sp. Root268]|uniref:hypothetical protein n=1 Tax=Rhizobium sp. Root268 TaxID=1736506 RepID=UPI0006F8A2AB|nr:hypothetical protein [Rhizobium sp. Root268]KRD25154.1 hypothetical protein ASE37_24880 [Rhizobium sp. Root268]
MLASRPPDRADQSAQGLNVTNTLPVKFDDQRRQVGAFPSVAGNALFLANNVENTLANFQIRGAKRLIVSRSNQNSSLFSPPFRSLWMMDEKLVSRILKFKIEARQIWKRTAGA